MKIGFIGLGIMGSGMVANLLQDGHEVTVTNRTAARAEPLVERGAGICGHPGGRRGCCTGVADYHAG
ncbi:MAG: NAD(P)-binding domain-containing protein [Chloroflexota bacterium]